MTATVASGLLAKCNASSILFDFFVYHCDCVFFMPAHVFIFCTCVFGLKEHNVIYVIRDNSVYFTGIFATENGGEQSLTSVPGTISF